jgi:hypothetical protein
MFFLVNMLILFPIRLLFRGRNAIWYARQANGERVFPVRPDVLFGLGLVAAFILAGYIVELMD